MFHRVADGGTTVIPKEVRWEIWVRDNYTCRQCGNRKDLVIDHVIPTTKNGKTEIDNLQTLCRPCNTKKSNAIEVTKSKTLSIPKVNTEQQPIYLCKKHQSFLCSCRQPLDKKPAV